MNAEAMQLTRWRLLGRPVKPVAFSLMVTMAVAFGEGFDDDSSRIGETVLAHLGSAFAGLVAVALLVGWWRRRQRVAEYGLLGAVFVWLSRLLLYVFVTEADWERITFAVAWTVIAAGSYILEVQDAREDRGVR